MADLLIYGTWSNQKYSSQDSPTLYVAISVGFESYRQEEYKTPQHLCTAGILPTHRN